MTGRPRAALTVASFALFGALCAPAPAGAHAVLVRSQPADGSTLAGAPHEIRLRFNETISPRFRLARLVDGRGRVVPGTSLRAGDDGRSLVLQAPRLRRGTYEVLWDVLAEADGHVTDGALVFGVGARPSRADLPRAVDAAPKRIEVALRWLDFSLLAILIGALVMSRLLGSAGARRGVDAGVRQAAAGRVLTGALCGGVLALGVGAVVLVREAYGLLRTLPADSALPDALGQLLTARWGILWLTRETLLAVLVLTALHLLRRLPLEARAPMRGAYAVAAGCAIGVIVCRALGAHAAAVGSSSVPVAADAVHVLAACVWVGGVLAFAVALWPAGGVGRRGSVDLARACRGGFAGLAALSTTLLAATGLYAAGVQVSSIDGLLTTFYGWTLIVKVGLGLCAAALGAVSFALLRSLDRERAPSGLRGLRRLGAARILLIEATVGLEVLVAAAVLTASSPPRGPAFDPPQRVQAPALVRQVRDLLVTATARPNRPGTNVFTVLAQSSRRPPPAPIDAIALRLAPAGGDRGRERTVPLSEIAPGRYAGGADLTQEGRWRMSVVLRRGSERLTAQFGWAVQPPDPARPVRYSAGRLAPLADWAAACCLILAVIGALLLALRWCLRRMRANRLLAREVGEPRFGRAYPPTVPRRALAGAVGAAPSPSSRPVREEVT